MRWLDRIAHFNISIKHKVEKNLALTDYLHTHPPEEAMTAEIYKEEYFVSLNRNWKSNIEIAKRKKFIPHFVSKEFTPEQAQAILLN